MSSHSSEPLLCANGTIDAITRFNESDLLLYHHFAPQINNIVEKISYPFWCTLGLPGSLLSIVIWSRRQMRKTGSVAAATYQASLGAGDFAFFLVQMMWYLHAAWKMRVLDYSLICEIFAFANYLIMYMSPILTLAFTIERFVTICYPYRSAIRTFGISQKGALKVIAASVCLSAFIACPQGYFFTIINGKCGMRPEFEESGKQEYIVYTVWVTFTEMLIFGLIPITCLILNVFVIASLRRIAARNQDINYELSLRALLKSSTSNDRKVSRKSTSSVAISSKPGASMDKTTTNSSTITLLCVSFYLIFAHLSVAVMVLLFIVLPMGDLCLSDEEITKDPTWLRHFTFFTARSFIESFGISHYAAKFFIYLATSAAFRKEFCKIFCIYNHNLKTRSLSVDELPNFANESQHALSEIRPPRISLRLLLKSMSLSCPVYGKSMSDVNNQRKRPQPGLSRDVLSESGDRDQVK